MVEIGMGVFIGLAIIVLIVYLAFAVTMLIDEIIDIQERKEQKKREELEAKSKWRRRF